MGGAMLSKSLIQFSVQGRGMFPPWSNMVEVMKIMGPPSKGPMQALHSVLPTLQQATVEPCLCPRLLDTHKQVWVNHFWGHCSFLLGPGTHTFLSMPSKSLFPQSCVTSGNCMVGLMATSSKRAYTIPRSTAPRAPAPAAVHC